MSRPVYVVDLEADDLLDDVTKIHVVSYSPLHTLDVKSITNYDEMREFFSQEDLVVIGHNFVGYDAEVVKKILGVEPTYKIVDTLFASWYLESSSSVIKHGLAEWGEKLGVAKPEISSWTDLSLEEYVHRCEQDVTINWKLWKEVQQPYLKELYNNDTDEIHRLLEYLYEKADLFREQEEVGIGLDIHNCLDSLIELQNLAEEKTKLLVEAMPKIPIKGVKSKPKVMYTKNEELSALGEKWLDFLNEQGYGPSEDGPIEYIKGWEDGNPASSEQVKKWLYDLGWEPKHIKFIRDKKTNEYRQIPQYVSEFEKGELCESVKALFEKEPALEHLSGLSTINHRIGFLKGFIERFKGNGRVYQSIGGLTNTLRVKHRVPLANLPKPGLPYSDSIRECLIAGEGNVFIGADLSSIEDKIKFEYINAYDPEFVADMQSDTFDPHLSTAVAGGLITEEESDLYKHLDKGIVPMPDVYKDKSEAEIKELQHHIKEKRHIGKTTNYACVPMDTEVLTKSGWKRYEELSIGDRILSYNTETGVIEEDNILHLHYFEDKDVYSYQDEYIGFRCTDDHRWFVNKRIRTKSNPHTVNKFVESKDLTGDCNIIMSAPLSEEVGGDISKEKAAVLSWLLSEGYYKWSTLSERTSSSFGKKKGIIASISQSVKKYHRLLESDLLACGVGYKLSYQKQDTDNPVKIFRLKSSDIRDFLRSLGVNSDKHETDWVSLILRMSIETLDVFVDRFMKADGHHGNQITQNFGNIQEAITLAMYLLGKRVSVKNKTDKCSLIRAHKNSHVTMQNKKKALVGKEPTFCLTTKNSTFIMRQGHFMSITGNCQYGAGVSTIARQTGLPKKVAEAVHKGYWEKHKSINQFCAAVERKTVRGQMWLRQPISGFWYSLRTDKDVFSTCVQSSGVRVFDLWVRNIRKKGLRISANWHDEIVIECPEDRLPEYKQLIQAAMDEVNEELQLSVKIECSMEVGKRYSDVH